MVSIVASRAPMGICRLIAFASYLACLVIVWTGYTLSIQRYIN